MGEHRARRNWSLAAPTFALTAIVFSGVAGVAIGQTFVRPQLDFETSAHPNVAGGGQAGSVELNAPHAPVPAGRSRTDSPRPAPVRDLPTTAPARRAPAPQPTRKPAAAPAEIPAAQATPPVADSPTPTVSAYSGRRKCKERGE
jgi:hypothetical protein